MQTVDIFNKKSYKDCFPKSYEVYVCMPPEGTVILNKLEQYSVYTKLKRDYFTPAELESLRSKQPAKFNYIRECVASGKCYATSKSVPFIIAGIIGEFYTIKPDVLAHKYSFMQGEFLVPINDASLHGRLRGKYLPWTKISTHTDKLSVAITMACFVPVLQRGQIRTSSGTLLDYNAKGVSHGKGDFIVCTKLPTGLPNLADMWVVNGEIFKETYDNRAFQGCFSDVHNATSITIDKLPNLIPERL